LFGARRAANAARAHPFVRLGDFMFAHSMARRLGVSGRCFASPSRRSALRAGLLLAAMLAQGCASAPPAPLAGPNPADPGATVPPARYGGTLGPYVGARPVEAGSWREQNERIAPEPKP
jgi:hypothetical protein